MKKHLLTILAVLMLCLGLMTVTASAATVAEGTCGGEGDGSNLTWKVTDDGTLTISGEGAMKDYTETEEVDEETVIMIYAPWHKYNESISKIVVGEGVTYTGEFAFYSSDATEVQLPSTLTTIGRYSFGNCELLPTLEIPAGVTTIEEYAFSRCDVLAGVELPDGLKKIGGYAFDRCYALTSIELPDTLTTVGMYAFTEATALEEVVIWGGANLTIDLAAFQGCSALTSVTFKGNAPTFNTQSFEYTYPTFKGVTATVYYPAAATGWTDAVKTACGGNLTWVAVNDGPVSDEDIGDVIAQGSCGANVTWEVTDKGVLTISGTGAMTDWDAYYNVPWADYQSDIVRGRVSEGVTTIGACTFAYCSGMKSVELPHGVTTIGKSAFQSCRKLTAITIPASVTSIGYYSFWYCDALAEVTFNGSAPTIDSRGFWGTTSTCYYSKNDPSWTDSVKQNYAGALTWVAADLPAITTQPVDVTVEDGASATFAVAAVGTGLSYQWQRYVGGEWLDAFETNATAKTATFVTAAVNPAISGLQIRCKITDANGNTLYSNIVTLTVESDVELIDFAFARMILGNALDMQFAFPKAGVESGAYVEVVRTAADGTKVAQTIPYADFKSATISGVAHYYVTYSGIAAKEMADTLVATVYDKNGNALSNGWEDSVREYALRSLRAANATTKNKTMLVDMLNYGAAAQTYFSYNASDLANKDLTAAEKALATTAQPCVNEQVKGAKNKGSRLILESSIKVQQAFSGLNNKMYAVVSYTNHNGKKVSERIEGSEFQIASVSIIELDQIALADARTVYTLTIYNANGTKYDTHVDSVASYIARASDNALHTAIMAFADSAYTYFHG